MKMAKKVDHEGLTYDNVKALVDDGYTFFEYSTDSQGRITSLNEFNDGRTEEVNGLTGYNKNSRLLNSDAATYYVKDTTLVYIQYTNGDGEIDYKVYTGGFPKLSDGDGNAATGTIIGADMKTTSGTNELKAIYVSAPDATSTTGVSSKENVSGYLRSITSGGNSTDGYYYEYTIAYDGDVNAKFRTATVSDRDDLSTLETDEGALLPFAPFVGGVVVFDINADGTISNMDLKVGQTAEEAGVFEDGKYYATYMVTNYNSANKTITVLPVNGEDGADLSARILDADAVLAAVNNEEVSAITFTCASDVNVYEFTVGSSNSAKVEVGSMGTLTKPTYDEDDAITEGYLITFGFDDEDELVTDIFFNNKVVK